MKLPIALISLAFTGLLCSYIQTQDGTPLDGGWELRDFTTFGKTTINPNPKNAKIYDNGRFSCYKLFPSGSKKTTGGTFKMLDENFYTETIDSAVNKPMMGKTYKIKYQIRDSLLLISGTFDSPIGVISYSETWVKVNPKIVASLGDPSNSN